MDFNEEEKQRVEERVYLIRDLKRKYGNDIEEILKYKQDIISQVKQIENSEENVLVLKEEIKHVKETMKDLSRKMNKMRVENSDILANRVNMELVELEMRNAKFKVKVDYSETVEFNENGQDNIQFLISTNIGEENKPLTKIASGGEMSRIMLAIKNVLADVDEVPIMIFDEIDTGISGKAAKSVGEKLKQIAKKHQVICITHQANIAAKGDYNYYISKIVQEERTITNIKQLSEEETINEIARITSGECSKLAIEHAKELRKIA